jgi:hypothetical protein
MKRNYDGRRTLCVVTARTSSLVTTINELQAYLGKAFEFMCVVGMVVLAACAAHIAYTDMIQLSLRVESIEERSRAIDEFVKKSIPGIALSRFQ